MKVNQTKLTIQGEGRQLGSPIILIRLTGCNLSCKFCDTKTALKDGVDIDPKKFALDIFNKYIINKSYIPTILFTGGEPLLQIDDIKIFILELYKYINTTVDVIIETNGTQLVNSDICFLLEDLDSTYSNIELVVSPKLNKLFYKDKNIDFISMFTKIHENIIAEYLNVTYKFIYIPEDIDLILEIYKITNIGLHNHFCMAFTPQNKKEYDDNFHQNCLNTVSFCIKYGLTYTPREHLYLFGRTNKEWEDLNDSSTD